MEFCKRCVNPSTRPTIVFDAEGVCVVCRFQEKKQANLIDWDARRLELEAIASWGKEHSASSYDCIVAVSGGKDSTRQALHVRDVLGLKPLLVSMVYPPEQLHERGAHNLSNLVSLGFDTVTVSLNPQIWKKLMRESHFRWANWCRSTELALYALPIHFAIAYGVPLVFLGENPTFTVGETEGPQGGEANGMQYCNTLAGGSAAKFLMDGVTEQDLYFYNYPTEKDVKRAGIRIIYLGYYIEDFNSFRNAEIAGAHGLRFRDEPPEETGEFTCSQSLDEEFFIVNQMIKHVKYGYGAVTDKAIEAMNVGLLTREEAIELIRKYDGKCHPRYVESYCKYIGITDQEFWDVVEDCRSPDVWERDASGQWVLKANLE